MARVTAEERALARAAVYRLLSVSFGYPAGDAVGELTRALPVATAAAGTMSDRTARAVSLVAEKAESLTRGELEAAYQRCFTLSYNQDCPLYETAFSARHIYQQTQQQADISGFYRAFGVDSHAERPDHLSLELEFLYLLTLKEAWAREQRDPDRVAICRDAQKAFLRDHLARWAPHVAGRTAVAGRGTLYESAARLLLAFVEEEERYLRLGAVERFSDEPVLIADEPGEFICPMVDAPVPVDIQPLQETS